MKVIWSKNVSLLLVVVSSSVLILGCSDGLIPESKKIHRAPTSDRETGVIVSGLSESGIAKLLSKNSNLTVRPVNSNHNLNEVYGASVSELKGLIDDENVIVEKNKFIEIKSFEVKNTQDPIVQNQQNKKSKNPLVQTIEENQGVKLEGEILNYIDSCKLSNILAPKVVVSNNQGRDRMDNGIFFEIDQSLTLNAEKSTPHAPGTKLNYLWIVTPPEYSALPPMTALDDRLTYTADSTGMHIYSVVAKDESGYCQIDMNAFYVTANYEFTPENSYPDSFSEKIDAEVFWHVFHVGAQAAWKAAVGAGMIVGIIDSGVDYNHPALSSNIYINKGEIPHNGIDDDSNGFIDDVAGYDFGQDDASPFDDYGHGTHVAGIAASNVFGAARKARILPTKFGAGLGLDIASAIGAIKYSVDSGAKVLNMSFGWNEDLEIVRQAMDYVEAKDVLVVAASGNETSNNDSLPSFPCNYKHKNIISIAATDENDALTFYSNYGQSVHLGAPGGTPERPIISSYKKNPTNNLFVGLMGTSMASPLVAGVAAQIWSANPNLTAVQIKQILLETGKPVATLDGKILSGKVVDTESAMNRVLATRLESSLWPY